MRAQDRSKWRQLVETAMLTDGRATRWWWWRIQCCDQYYLSQHRIRHAVSGMCKGAEAKVSVPLLYWPTNILWRWILSSATKQNVVANKFHCHVVTWPPVSTSIVLSSCGSHKKLPSMQRRRQTISSMQNLQIRPRHDRCRHCTMYFVAFLILSLMPIFKHVPKIFPGHACNGLTTG